jgi:hypothetical protein
MDSTEEESSSSVEEAPRPRLTKEEMKTKFAETLGDKSKFKEAMKSLKRFDAKDASKVAKFTNMDQNIRRNALEIAEDTQMQRRMNDQMSKNQKKRAASTKKAAKDIEKASKYYQKGDIDCVCVVINGKLSTTKSNCETIEKEDRWVIHAVKIGDSGFLMICDSNILSGNNRIATAIIGEKVFGPVRFLQVGAEGVIPLTAKDFKILLRDNKYVD